MATEDMTHGGAHCGAKMRRASRRLLLPEELVEIERTVDKLAMNYLRKKTDSHARPFDNPLRDVIMTNGSLPPAHVEMPRTSSGSLVSTTPMPLFSISL